MIGGDYFIGKEVFDGFYSVIGLGDLLSGFDSLVLIHMLEEYKRFMELICDALTVDSMLGYLFGKASDLNSFAGESNSPVLIGMDVSHDVLWSVLRGGSHRRRPHGDNPVCSPFRRGGLVRKSPRRCVPPLSSISFALWPRIGEAAHPGPYSVGGASSSLGAAAFTPPPQCLGEEEQTINEGPFAEGLFAT